MFNFLSRSAAVTESRPRFLRKLSR